MKYEEGWKQWAYIALSVVGFVGYIVLACLLFFVLLLYGGIIALFWGLARNEPEGIVGMLTRLLEYPLLWAWQLLAGVLGLGARRAKPIQIPFKILASIPTKAKPNDVTFFLGFPTLVLGILLMLPIPSL